MDHQEDSILLWLDKLFEQNIDLLDKEIKTFKKEENLWIIKPGISNSAGNLSLHLCGNLKHYIGALLGNSGYVRQRQKEFDDKNVPLSELVKNIAETREIVSSTIIGLSTHNLSEEFPVSVNEITYTTEAFLIHLHSHLGYHLGQINYLRRLLEA